MVIKMKKIRWGIIGTGTIAKKFAGTLGYLSDECEFVGVASRSIENAEAFAKQYGAKKAFGSYQELAQSADIDAVYIATPHNSHYENSLLCLKNNKHVLCEKSFTIDVSQAEHLFKQASDNSLFIMEAFWTKFLPAYAEIHKILNSGQLGDVVNIAADFGINPPGSRNDRKINPELAGGALYDVGIYVIGITCMLLGYEPKSVVSNAVLSDGGVDLSSFYFMQYESGQVALLSSSVEALSRQQAVIQCKNGYIVIDTPHAANGFTVYQNDNKKEYNFPFDFDGFEYQLRHTNDCIRQGETVSDIMKPHDTIAVLKIMDNMRKEWGMKFPFEI